MTMRRTTRVLYQLGLLQAFLITLIPHGGKAQAGDSPEQRRPGAFHRAGDSVLTWLREPVPPKGLRWKAVLIPTTLITYGTVSVATGWFDEIDIFGRDLATRGSSGTGRRTRIDDFSEYAPAVAVFGLNIAGVRGKHNPVDAAFLYASSIGIAHVITIPTKRISSELRPDSSDLLSFPSGHTTTAFVSAEFLRQEYKGVSPWIGVGGYAVAALTGYLRIYNNKHWFSDVIAGAGVGILSTRLSYWLYPVVKNKLNGKSAGGTTMILPTWQNGTIGFCITHRF